MNDKPLDELSDQEFDRLIDSFLTRPDDPVTPTIFLSDLREFRRDRAAKVVELTADVISNQLRFDPAAPLPVQGNEFVFSDTRFVVKLCKVYD
ncbi:hypothetical protein FJZ31_42580 [Candidatus Poribacteria bacterium]|nr:hypothetical protein [Candidatus Poribacteria bacterium]